MRPSVLIVEPSAEEREVLRTVLERRGLTILEAAGAEAGLELARRHHPNVIVLDVEAGKYHDGEMQARFDAASEPETSLIILGRASRGSHVPAGQVIAKPYHYAPLIHKIEQLAAKAA